MNQILNCDAPAWNPFVCSLALDQDVRRRGLAGGRVAKLPARMSRACRASATLRRPLLLLLQRLSRDEGDQIRSSQFDCYGKRRSAAIEVVGGARQ